MEISKNEVNYFKSIVEHLYYVGKAQKYIREQFGFESEYDDEGEMFIERKDSREETCKGFSEQLSANSVNDTKPTS